MNVFFDVDLGASVSGIGSRIPAPAIVVKSQDTLDLNCYMVSAGVVQDYGASAQFKFGLVAADPPWSSSGLLSLATVSTRMVDSSSKAFYQLQPNLYSVNLVAALGDNASISCLGEVRYELADGSITHSISFPVTVLATLVPEVVPPVEVLDQWPDISVVEVKTNRDIPGGYPSLNPSGELSISVIPPGVVLESERNAPLGFAGLDSSGYASVTSVRIDGTSIVAVGGKLTSVPPTDGVTTKMVGGELVAYGPAQGTLTSTIDAFTVPAAGSTVSITVPTTSLTEGIFYNFAGAGLYQFITLTDGFHGVFQNVDSAGNAVPGTIIPSDSVVSWSGPPGPAGAAGSSIGCKTTASFTVPANGATVDVDVDSEMTFRSFGQGLVYVGPDIGIFELSDYSTGTLTLLHNTQYYVRVAIGTTIPAGTTIVPLGVKVYDGDPDNHSGGVTLVTDDLASDTQWLPAIKRLKATDGSIVLDTTTSDLCVGIRATASGSGGSSSTMIAGWYTSAPFTVPAVGSTVDIFFGTTFVTSSPIVNGELAYLYNPDGTAFYGLFVATVGMAWNGVHEVLTVRNDAQYSNSGSNFAPPGTVIPTGTAVTKYPRLWTNHNSVGVPLVSDATLSSTELLPAMKGLKSSDSSISLTNGNVDIDIKGVIESLTSTDITTGNASTSKHGLLKKLDNTATHYMDGTGAWSTPGGGGIPSVHTEVALSSNWTYANDTAIPWAFTNYDYSTPLWSSGAPTRLTLPMDGYYLLTIFLTINWATTPGIMSVWVLNDGGGVSLQHNVNGSGYESTTQGVNISGVVKLLSGHYIELKTSVYPLSYPTSLYGGGSAGCKMSINLIGT